MSGEERCVCCGAIIPEGKQVCSECERKTTTNDYLYVGYSTRDKLRYTASGTQEEMIAWFDMEFIKPGTTEIRIWRLEEWTEDN